MRSALLPSSRRRRWKISEGTLLLLTGLLLLSSVAILLAEERARPGKERVAQGFQTLVHGTGFGPSGDLSVCAFAFDPRIAARCPHDLGPLPLGGAYCPAHALALFSYPAPATGGPDAHSP